jgi:hypothetical protein
LREAGGACRSGPRLPPRGADARPWRRRRGGPGHLRRARSALDRPGRRLQIRPRAMSTAARAGRPCPSAGAGSPRASASTTRRSPSATPAPSKGTAPAPTAAARCDAARTRPTSPGGAPPTPPSRTARRCAPGRGGRAPVRRGHGLARAAPLAVARLAQAQPRGAADRGRAAPQAPAQPPRLGAPRAYPSASHGTGPSRCPNRSTCFNRLDTAISYGLSAIRS